MKNLFKILIILIPLLVINACNSGSNSNIISNEEDNISNMSVVATTQDENGNIYAAIRDEINGDYVEKFSNGAWSKFKAGNLTKSYIEPGTTTTKKYRIHSIAVTYAPRQYLPSVYIGTTNGGLFSADVTFSSWKQTIWPIAGTNILKSYTVDNLVFDRANYMLYLEYSLPNSVLGEKQHNFAKLSPDAYSPLIPVLFKGSYSGSKINNTAVMTDVYSTVFDKKSGRFYISAYTRNTSLDRFSEFSIWYLDSQDNYFKRVGRPPTREGKIMNLAVDSNQNLYCAVQDGGIVWYIWYINPSSSTWSQLYWVYSHYFYKAISVDSDNNVIVVDNYNRLQSGNINNIMFAPDLGDLPGNKSNLIYGFSNTVPGGSVGVKFLDDTGALSIVNTSWYNDSRNRIWHNLGALFPAYYTPINSLAIGNNGTLYAGTSGGYVMYTTPGSSSWSMAGGSSPNSYITSVAIGSNGTIYVGNWHGNVMYTTPGSSSWSMVGGSSPDGSAITSVAIGSNGNVYAGTYFGNVMYTTLGSSSWSMVGGSSPNRSTIRSVAIGSNGTVYAGTSTGNVMYNAPGLSSWSIVGGSSPDGSPINSVAIGSNGTVYAGTSAGNVMYNIFGTAYWNKLGGSSPDRSPINSVAIYSNDIVCAGTQNGNVWYTTPGSSSWSTVGGSSPDRSRIHSLVGGSNGTVYVGTELGKVMMAYLPAVIEGAPIPNL